MARPTRHGSLAGYTHQRCRCGACRKAWRDYRREYERERKLHGRRMIDVAETRRHLRRLQGAGMSIIAVADRAGLAHSTVSKIARGQTTRVSRRIADRILAIPVDRPIAGHAVPARFVRPLLADFRAAGLSGRRAFRAAGLSPNWDATRGHARVYWQTWRRLTVLHRLLARQGMLAPRLEIEEVHVS